jgi:hypothetical protein
MAPKCWTCRLQKWPRGEDWSGQEILYCWERERAEREERERERERERQVLKYLSVRLGMIWLVRILWFMLIEGWGSRRIQARLEAGSWPWKTEAKACSKNRNLSATLWLTLITLFYQMMVKQLILAGVKRQKKEILRIEAILAGAGSQVCLLSLFRINQVWVTRT